MVKRLLLLGGLVAIAVPAGGITVSAEPPSPGGQLFTSATAPCSNGTAFFNISAGENAAGQGGGSGAYALLNTFPPGNCGTNPTGSELNLNCVEVSGQEVFASGTYSLPGGATGPVLFHVLAGTAPEIGIDFPASIHGGGWRCDAAKVPMVPATGLVQLTPA